MSRVLARKDKGTLARVALPTGAAQRLFSSRESETRVTTAEHRLRLRHEPSVIFWNYADYPLSTKRLLVAKQQNDRMIG